MGGGSTLGYLVFVLWNIPCVTIPSLIHSPVGGRVDCVVCVSVQGFSVSGLLCTR